MIVIRTPERMKAAVSSFKRKRKTIGLVPTMGALHEGHLSLIRKASRENDIVVVSIFVNPAQFGPGEDYLRYPRPFSKDRALCRKEGVDIIFSPGVKAMYPDGHRTYVTVEGISDALCGRSRPGHFRGVATVVAKLFNITGPDRAYFGLKDYQQLKVIERMAGDLNFHVKIVPCPIFRERSGLAMSSRNVYLSKIEKDGASLINKALQQGVDLIKYKKSKNSGKIIKILKDIIRKIPGSKIDYIEIRDPQTLEAMIRVKRPAVILCAAWVGGTRLIDNVLIK